MKSDDVPLWRGYVFQVMLVVLGIILGGISSRYVFRDKPELTYQPFEGDPIETELGKYYPTSFIITNTGDVPLSEVRVNLKFDGKIDKVSSTVEPDRSLDDSVSIKREFRMPKGLSVQFKITSRGRLSNANISSAEVVGQILSATTSEKKPVSVWDIILYGLGGGIIGGMSSWMTSQAWQRKLQAAVYKMESEFQKERDLLEFDRRMRKG